MTDKLFLLSINEYKTYKAKIPHINTWWWLRSPGGDSRSAAGVDDDGSVDYYGDFVYFNDFAVRPALKLESNNLQIGDRIAKYQFPWIYIGDNLAIAEVPIAFRWFDAKDSNYETSEIKKFLNDWLKEREE